MTNGKNNKSQHLLSTYYVPSPVRHSQQEFPHTNEETGPTDRQTDKQSDGMYPMTAAKCQHGFSQGQKSCSETSA